MPTYGYKCTSEVCSSIMEDQSSMSLFKDHHPSCIVCGSVSNYVWVPSVPQVAFKDGPSGGWVSKGLRFQNIEPNSLLRQNADKTRDLAHRSKHCRIIRAKKLVLGPRLKESLEIRTGLRVPPRTTRL